MYERKYYLWKRTNEPRDKGMEGFVNAEFGMKQHAAWSITMRR